jgi:bacillithiol biosynthesis cysteine-adding enzyme BshC
MKASYIEYSETGQFASGVLRYLAQDAEALSFAKYPPSLAGFKELLSSKKVQGNRSVLVEVLQQQYNSLETSAAVTQNIEALAKENTFTITTGHQLNLFTGPLYFIYKIASAIALSKELKHAFPDKHFVPLYWMATEDHDFAEINHTYIHGKKLVWEKEASGATGQLSTNDIDEILQAYQGILGASPYALQLTEWVEQAYTQHNNLADATRYLVNKLFEKYGLIILDANHPELKKQFSSIIEEDICQQHSSRLINETITHLQAAGFDTPAKPREINFFYLKKDLRERIIKENSQYRVVNTDIVFTEVELRTQIQNHPEEFSPNVVMRPLYQECILPNICYIGGGAELSYWLELKSTFEQYKLDFPIVLLRNSAQQVSASIAKKQENLNLSSEAMFKPLDTLKKEWILANAGKNLSLKNEMGAFEEVFKTLGHRANEIDPSLVASAAAVETRLKKAMENLEKKLLKAEKQKHTGALEQLEKIHAHIFPIGGLQERSENFGSYFAAYGPAFIYNLIENFHPLKGKFTLIQANN